MTDIRLLMEDFRLDSADWIRNPRGEAQVAVESLARLGGLMADALMEANNAQIALKYYEATAGEAHLAKHRKDSQYKVELAVRSHPKWLALQANKVAADAEVRKLEQIDYALRRKTWLIGKLYELDQEMQ